MEQKARKFNFLKKLKLNQKLKSIMNKVKH